MSDQVHKKTIKEAIDISSKITENNESLLSHYGEIKKIYAKKIDLQKKFEKATSDIPPDIKSELVEEEKRRMEKHAQDERENLQEAMDAACLYKASTDQLKTYLDDLKDMDKNLP